MKSITNLVSDVVSFANEQKSGFDQKLFTNFTKIFFTECQYDDIKNYSVKDLYFSAALSFGFFSVRNPKQFKVRIYNPSVENDGFESFHTFFDIVSDDMPFLVDSIVAHLDKSGIKIHNVIHPIYSSLRDKSGNVKEVFTAEKISEKSVRESLIQLHLEKITSDSEIKILQEEITKILETVALVVDDWKLMVDLAKRARKQIGNATKITEDIAEIKDFISWLIDGNFILFGAIEFNIKKDNNGEYSLEEVNNGEGLGIFRSEYSEFRPKVLNSSIREVGDSVENPYVIEILKARYRSKIHRLASAERIRIQKISDDGKVIGEFRLIGLFTSSVYHQSPTSIPLVRDKISKVIADSGYVVGGHNYKDLISILDSYPRDELFQISTADLLKTATRIVAICGRSQIRFFARKDKFNRFVSCLIFMPRDRSNSDLREKIKDYLAESYSGEVVDFSVQIAESNLTRLHIIVRADSGIPELSDEDIENKIIEMASLWSDDMRQSIKARFSDGDYVNLFSRYKNSFSVSYINRFDAKRAAIDIERIEDCLKRNSVIFNLYKSSEILPEHIAELKIYSPQGELALSSIMPLLESFGFNVIQEYTYVVNVLTQANSEEKQKVYIHYFHIDLSALGVVFSQKMKMHFEKAVVLIWEGVMQVGHLNKLIISADLFWKKVYLLRAYTKYLNQIGFRYSQGYIADALVKYPEIVQLLVSLFENRFDPNLSNSKEEREKKVLEISNQIKDALNRVRDVTDDEVIRRLFNLINATIRTNYYQRAEPLPFKGYVSFKFDCKLVPNLPLPMPYAEIFVYSAKVEAVHLRGGKVARGGLRWSDRNEDFRTEVLGLMKAQMTKNAVIVPVGSKGGFVLKRNVVGLSRDEIQKEAIECYKTFLRGLLDITDNIVNGKIEHPHNVVRYDAADPYLVVAADKGTATFSDIANSISAEYNFWLGDAFASGGSVGYDHKKMGITAKGAWISVMRHFREMGVDTQNQDFTCVGVGDLAGDVFGNGMLLSKHIKLVAAFNHMHIFLDPDPNPSSSFTERNRIFNLPRSTWMDYDKSLISKGGGVFERSAKTIKISSEVKVVLGIEEDELPPTKLIRAILKAPVDLLWNGGIGTYVKSAEESDQDVSDRANDVLRVNGSELRCKIVGEGGNLGFTQKGRIEYALNGGRINTDAMDNSAGVDCSDHEVNIKIALIEAMRAKKVTFEERNKILESMTDEVADLVLKDNRLQTQIISIAASKKDSALDNQSQFLNRLEKSGLLNRQIEFLPSKKEIDKRRIEKIGLTRPELCVMLAYSKMDIYNSLLSSKLLKDKYFQHELFCYFPKLMQEKFADEIENHQLKDEIIATQITNFVVSRAGITFINQICQDSGFGIADVVKNFIIACDSFRLRDLWEEIENLDGKIASSLQIEMFLSSRKLLERSIIWLLRNQSKGSVLSIITRFRKIADELSSVLLDVLASASKEAYEKKIKKYSDLKIDQKLAKKIAIMDPIASSFDIAEISAASNFDLKIIAKIYFAVGSRFSLKWLRNRVSLLATENYWQNLSHKTVLEDLYSCQMRIAKRVVEFSRNNENLCEVSSLDNWIASVGFLVERFDSFIVDLKVNSNPDLSVFIVALNRLKSLVS